MTKDQESLLHLVRLGVGCNLEPCFDFTGVDWEAVASTARNQAVPAIVLDGLQRLMAEFPEEDLRFQSPELKPTKRALYGSCISFEKRYARYLEVLGDFVGFCSGRGIKILLLKGYGLSLNYPEPSHRPCGDIDVYAFGESGLLDEAVTSEFGIHVDKSLAHHSVFGFKGFTVENHLTVLDVVRHRNQAYDEECIQGLINEGCDEIDIAGNRCFVPSVKMNSIYLLRHMAHHFAVENITLRHVLDWALFVRSKGSTIDWEYVFSYAEKTGCLAFLNCLNAICADSLGFEECLFPVRAHDSVMEKRMLQEILCPEFDGDIPPISDKIKYYFVKFRRLIANRWKYRMVSNEPLMTTVCNLALNRKR